MKRNPDSSRSKRWIERNSLNNESCKKYVNKLCEYENMENYKFSEYDYQELALWISYGLHSYIIEVDVDNICLKVLESNNRIENNYHLLKKNFIGDNCWYECLTWIKERI